MSGRRRGEEKTFSALVAAVGVDATEQVLLYHVVPGAEFTKWAAVSADGVVLTTARGGTISGRVSSRSLPIVDCATRTATTSTLS